MTTKCLQSDVKWLQRDKNDYIDTKTDSKESREWLLRDKTRCKISTEMQKDYKKTQNDKKETQNNNKEMQNDHKETKNDYK